MRCSLFKNVVLLPIVCWASRVLPAPYLPRSLTQCAGDLGHICRYPCLCKNCHPEGSALWLRNGEPFFFVKYSLDLINTYTQILDGLQCLPQ